MTIKKSKDTSLQTDTADVGTDILPVEIAGILGGVARRVAGPTGRAADSMLAVYKDRCTYTTIHNNEVASVHFDQVRQEIFFRGHNIKFMKLVAHEQQILVELETILQQDRKGRRLAKRFRETLDRLLADK